MRIVLPILLLLGLAAGGLFWMTAHSREVAALPPDSLIVVAVSADPLRARLAQRRLRQLGRCPNLAESPEGPVGLAGAAYDLEGSERQQVGRTIKLLLRQGCDIDQYSSAGLTPLHGAIIGRQPGLLDNLLEQGADPLLRVIPIPGSDLGRTIAHLDAYGVALVLKTKFPDDKHFGEILNRLRPET